MWLGIAALACGLLGLGAAQAPASGVLTGFTLTPASTQAGSAADVTADLRFAYADGTDSVRSVTIDLAPGLLASIENVPATCTLDQLRAMACPAGSQIGAGTVTTNRTPLDTGLYLMAPPAPGDAAGFGTAVRAGGNVYTGVGTLDVVTVGGQPLGVVTLGVPVVAGEQVFELRATMNATTADGRLFTRLPTSCATATSGVSVETQEANPGTGSDSFVPTGCAALGYAPSLSSVQVIKDPNDSGAELIASLSQPNVSTESATGALELDWPSSLSPIVGPVAACLSGTPCTIGTATATSPLAPPSYLSGGTVVLGGSAHAPTLTVAFPSPVRLSIVGAIDPASGTVTFPVVPDVPLSALTVDIAGPAGARALSTTCAPGALTARFTPQSGGATVTSAQQIAYRGCPRSRTRPPPPPPRLKAAIRSSRALVVHRRAPATLACSGGPAGSVCRGTLSLTVRERIVVRVHRRRRVLQRTVVLASARYAIASGRTRTVSLPLTAAGLRLLARTRGHRLHVRATASVRGGATVHRTIVVRLEPPTRSS